MMKIAAALIIILLGLGWITSTKNRNDDDQITGAGGAA